MKISFSLFAVSTAIFGLSFASPQHGGNDGRGPPGRPDHGGPPGGHGGGGPPGGGWRGCDRRWDQRNCCKWFPNDRRCAPRCDDRADWSFNGACCRWNPKDSRCIRCDDDRNFFPGSLAVAETLIIPSGAAQNVAPTIPGMRAAASRPTIISPMLDVHLNAHLAILRSHGTPVVAIHPTGTVTILVVSTAHRRIHGTLNAAINLTGLGGVINAVNQNVVGTIGGIRGAVMRRNGGGRILGVRHDVGKLTRLMRGVVRLGQGLSTRSVFREGQLGLLMVRGRVGQAMAAVKDMEEVQERVDQVTINHKISINMHSNS